MKTLKKYWLAVITLVILPINISAQSLKEKAESGDKVAQYNYAKSLEGVDKKKAFQWYKKSAEQGCDSAEYALGCAYYAGVGVRENEKRAFEWWSKAADKGNSDAMVELGHCYELGEGVKENESKAVEWYKKSAETYNAHGEFCLALKYLYGHGVGKDSIMAASLLMQSACGGKCKPSLLEYDEKKSGSLTVRKTLLELSELDNSPKQYYFLYMVGCMYDAMQDFSNAEKYYKLAINKGSVGAMTQLGVMYYCLSPYADSSGRTIESYFARAEIDEDLILKYNKTKEWKENDNAAYYLEEAVKHGNGHFRYGPIGLDDVYDYLMDTYQYGLGTSINIEKAVDVAYTVCNCLMDHSYRGLAYGHAGNILESALSPDLPQLHNKLFNIYSNIYTCVKNNPNDDSVYIYNLKRIAYTGLGKCYYKGFGVNKDYNKAFNYLSEAAEYYGSGESMRLLAACYRYGRGVKADPNKDKEWSARAAERGDEQAKKLAELRSKWGLSPIE